MKDINKKNKKLARELKSFEGIWHGGYFSGYSEKRNQKGLEEYLKINLEGSTLLEIGCGGGQWSKFIYDLAVYKKIHCVDALSETHNKFWDYLGEEARTIINYKQVKDFSLDFIEDNSLDYVFSYDVFCHISFSGLNAYLETLSKKCKKNSKLLIMYADPKKYLISEPENRNHVARYLPNKKLIYNFSRKRLIFDALEDFDGDPCEGRWYWIGKKNFLEACLNNGFEIIKEDINVDKTNPITLFTKK
tara:strand:- start:442 stop:1182 length:741 start_codon:yes stop_codon:yes gene_type:complete